MSNGVADDAASQGSTANGSIADDTLVEFNGKQVPLKELKEGYMRTEDYTKKTQELSAVKKGSKGDTDDADDDAKLEERMRKRGVIFDDKLQKIQEEQTAKQNFDRLVENNPSLRQFSELIRDTAKRNNIAPEDVIEKYNFGKKADLITDARDSSFRGDNGVGQSKQTRGVRDLSPEEYAEFISKARANGGHTKAGSFT